MNIFFLPAERTEDGWERRLQSPSTGQTNWGDGFTNKWASPQLSDLPLLSHSFGLACSLGRIKGWHTGIPRWESIWSSWCHNTFKHLFIHLTNIFQMLVCAKAWGYWGEPILILFLLSRNFHSSEKKGVLPRQEGSDGEEAANMNPWEDDRAGLNGRLWCGGDWVAWWHL